MTFTSLGSSLGAVKRESLEAVGQLMGRLEQQLTHCDGWLESRCCLRGVVGGDGRAGDQLKATKSKKLVVGCNPACPKNLGTVVAEISCGKPQNAGAPRRQHSTIGLALG